MTRPAPEMVQRSIANLAARLAAHQQQLDAKMDAIFYAQSDLDRQVIELALQP